MTEPRYAACRCSHEHAQHPQKHDGMCIAPACGCLTYRPVGAASRPATSPPALGARKEPAVTQPQQSPLAQMFQRAKDSGDRKLTSLAEKAEHLCQQLRAELAARDQQATARRQIADLEAQLAAARAKVGGRAKSGPKSDRPRTPCPDCDGSYANLGVHRSRAHVS